MTNSEDSVPLPEAPDPPEPDDAADAASRDSEIDFDDEREDDQLPLDELAANEAGALLDDPERLAEDEEEEA